WPRAATYALVGVWTFALARRVRGTRFAAASTSAALLGLALAIAAARLQSLAGMPWLAGALGLVWAWLALTGVGVPALDLPRGAARWLAASLLLRLALVAAPGFGSVDAQWHAHQLESFRVGQLVYSDAPGVAVSPYPPALYALLRPLATGDLAHDERLVRVAMGLLEGAAPLLVLALMRAAGAAPAAPAAGVAMAGRPDSVLRPANAV